MSSPDTSPPMGLTFIEQLAVDWVSENMPTADSRMQMAVMRAFEAGYNQGFDRADYLTHRDAIDM